MVVAAALVLSSGMAFAATINGTNKADNRRGTKKADRIEGWGGNWGGNDTLSALRGSDTYRFAPLCLPGCSSNW